MARRIVNRRLFRITYRTAGVWALFSIWLCVLFTITYGQTAITKSAGSAYKMMMGMSSSFTSVEAVSFQFNDEVGLLATNATIVLVLALMLAMLRPRYRFPLMGLSVVATMAIGMGLLEKIVYSRWTGSNETLLMAERTRESASLSAIGLGSWNFNPAAIWELGGMMTLDACIILASGAWAVANLRIARRKHAALQVAEIRV